MSTYVPYPEEVEAAMIAYFERLNERDARLYAAIEAMKLDHGGVTYIATLFNTSRDRIYTPRHQNFLFIKYQYLLNFLNKLYVSSYGLRDRSERPGRYR